MLRKIFFGSGEKDRPRLFHHSLFFFLLLASIDVFAQVPRVPHLINFQSVLTDRAGNPLASGLYTVHFRVLDSEGQELYQESQSVEADKGAVSTMVGQRGDLNLDIFDPKQTSFLGVMVEGQGPEKQMEIAAVPYSLYAEKALAVASRSIDAEAIQPHSITADLLSENVLAQLLTGLQQGGLPSVVISRSELESSSGANQVGVNSSFIYSGSATVQAVLKDLDTAIHQRRLNTERQIESLSGRVTTEVSRLDSSLQLVNGINTDLNVSLNENNSRLDSLEHNVDTLMAPPKVVAAGVVAFSSRSSPTLSWGYNISGVSGCTADISFSTPIATPYIVQVTPVENNFSPYVQNISSSGFSIMMGRPGCMDPAGPFHFVVFK